MHVGAFVRAHRMRSSFTPKVVTNWLASLAVETGTRARYHAALRQFGEYLVTTGVLERNPMREVKAPRPGAPRTRHLTKPEWVRLVDAQSEPFRTASVLAHLGVELAAVLRVKRRDVDLAARTIWVRGTKTRWRERSVYVFGWAAPYLERACRGLLPDAVLVPASRHQVSVSHRAACHALGIEDYRLHDARHSIAVWWMSGGGPAEEIATQLGHRDIQQVMRCYGRYRPAVGDMRRWERVIEERDREVGHVDRGAP
jgi:integrase